MVENVLETFFKNLSSNNCSLYLIHLPFYWPIPIELSIIIPPPSPLRPLINSLPSSGTQDHEMFVTAALLVSLPRMAIIFSGFSLGFFCGLILTTGGDPGATYTLVCLSAVRVSLLHVKVNL